MTVAVWRENKNKNCSLYRDCKLFLSGNWFEVVRIDCSVASISPFGVDVPPFSESIWSGIKTARVELNNKIELREVFGLLYLSLD